MRVLAVDLRYCVKDGHWGNVVLSCDHVVVMLELEAFVHDPLNIANRADKCNKGVNQFVKILTECVEKMSAEHPWKAAMVALEAHITT